MTTPQLLQQAKHGDPDAIAQLMNQSLSSKGIQATVSRQGDRLRVLLDASDVPNQTLLTKFVRKGIQNLDIPELSAVEIIGQSQASSEEAWSQVILLDESLASSSLAASSEIPPQSPLPSDVAVSDGRPVAVGGDAENQEDVDLSITDMDSDPLLEDFRIEEDLALGLENTIDPSLAVGTMKGDLPEEIEPQEELDLSVVGMDLSNAADLDLGQPFYGQADDEQEDLDLSAAAVDRDTSLGLSEPDELDLSAAAMESEFSLESALSLDEIDQIVADAVKEVTTQIQNEMPFEADDEGLSSILTGAGIPPEGLGDGNTAPQGGRVDTVNEQELTLADDIDAITEAMTLDTPTPDPLNLGTVDSGESEQYATDLSRLPLEQFNGTEEAVDAGGEDPAEAASDDELEDGSENPTDSESSEQGSSDSDTDSDDAELESGDADAAGQLMESTEDGPASRVLFALISLLTFGSIAGLIGYSLRSYSGNLRQFWMVPNDEPAVVEESNEPTEAPVVVEPAEPSLEDGETQVDPTAPIDPEAVAPEPLSAEEAASRLIEATDTGAQAEQVAQEAQSRDDLELAITQLDQAIALLQTIPPDSPSFTAAQERLEQYQSALDTTQETLSRQPEPDPDDVPTSITATVPEEETVTCPNVALGSSDTITVTQIALGQDAVLNDDVYPVTGCLTNHTDTPIVSVAINYQPTSGLTIPDAVVPGENGATTQPPSNVGQGQLVFENLAPGETVVFRTQLPVEAEAETIQFVGLAWRLEGADEAEMSPLELTLPLSGD